MDEETLFAMAEDTAIVVDASAHAYKNDGQITELIESLNLTPKLVPDPQSGTAFLEIDNIVELSEQSDDTNLPTLHCAAESGGTEESLPPPEKKTLEDELPTTFKCYFCKLLKIKN